MWWLRHDCQNSVDELLEELHTAEREFVEGPLLSGKEFIKSEYFTSISVENQERAKSWLLKKEREEAIVGRKVRGSRGRRRTRHATRDTIVNLSSNTQSGQKTQDGTWKSVEEILD
jgi:hypothetical protein